MESLRSSSASEDHYHNHWLPQWKVDTDFDQSVGALVLFAQLVAAELLVRIGAFVETLQEAVMSSSMANIFLRIGNNGKYQKRTFF